VLTDLDASPASLERAFLAVAEGESRSQDDDPAPAPRSGRRGSAAAA
jgi:hypothetical protein